MRGVQTSTNEFTGYRINADGWGIIVVLRRIHGKVMVFDMFIVLNYSTGHVQK